MRRNTLIMFSCLMTLAAYQPASAAESLCKTLRTFATSVKADETKVVRFHTIWGSNFKDRIEPASAAKRCDHAGFEPAKAICTYLMEYGLIEFPGQNAKSVIECLSSKSRFDVHDKLSSIAVSVKYGTVDRGSVVDIKLQEHADFGGMVLIISANGY